MYPSQTWLANILAGALLVSCGARTPSNLNEESNPPNQSSLQVSIPAGIHGHTVNANQDIIYADSFGNAAPVRYLYQIKSPYIQSRRIGVSGELPAGIEWWQGHYYICDTGADTITKLTASFEVVSQWRVNKPWNISFSKGGKMVAVTYLGDVVQLLPQARTKLLFDGLLGPFDLAFQGENSIWITEQGRPRRPGRVRLYSLTGDLEQQLDGDWLNPEGILLSGGSNLWINDTEAGRVWRVVLPSGRRTLVTGSYRLPIAISKFPNGDVLINGLANTYQFFRFSPTD